MNLVKTIDQYNDDNIYFCDSIKNNIMADSAFIRILYSTRTVTFNGIYLLLHLSDVQFDKYYNKYRCTFNVQTHKKLIDSLKSIEERILSKAEIVGKTPQLKIHEQLKNGNIKIFDDVIDKSSNAFILKISGIWETQYSYGLTFKFIKPTSHQL
jgi:hypothetical protein